MSDRHGENNLFNTFQETVFDVQAVIFYLQINFFVVRI